MAEGDTHEDQIEAARELLTGLRWKFWILSQNHKLRGSAGLPDVFAVASVPAGAYITQTMAHIGRLQDEGHTRALLPFWFEAKAGADKERPAQKAFKAVVQSAGNPVLTGRVEEIARFFELDRKRPCAKKTIQLHPSAPDADGR